MTPFRRGQFWSLYVPRQSGGVVQRACGTTDAKLARAMGRMVDVLQDRRRWDALTALDNQTLTVGQVFDAYSMNTLDALMEHVGSQVLKGHIETWLATLSLAPRTYANYEQRIRAMIPDEMRASSFTAGWVASTIAQLPFTGGTKRTYLSCLSLFADSLVAYGLLTANPVREHALVRRPKKNPPRKRWESAENDLRLVMATTDPDLRAYFALIHATGAERDAARVMLRRDLDLTSWTVHIPGTKNAKRDRRGVPVEPWAHALLREHVKDMLPDARLFPHFATATLAYAHIAARKAVGLDGYQLRDARHSYAVRAILRGVPIWQVSQWLGHATIAVTAQVYTQFGLDEALAALQPTSSIRATSGAT